ncbi:MAG TPA: TIGR02710 family CRISPR-associated CARF protein [bacterium]|nr:TIGR02710 family CRISPR-associated CARF protein [bacterium]HOM27636.1 TIGR02710 family CRISPR-associated CARF protein [bacterium]
MSRRILIITVGGSDEPVVSAIKGYNPDFIYFICSGGKPEVASSITIDGKDKNGRVINEKPCLRKKEIKCKKCGEIIEKGEKYPPIIEQAEYSESYEKVVLNDPDDFNEVYEKTKQTIEKALKEGDEIICDFTGGTKTMSSVLAILTAFEFKTKPSIVKGKREDIIKIKELSFPVLENVNSARVDFLLQIVNEFISRYLYYPAKVILENILTYSTFDRETQKKIIEKCELCTCFYYWDIFEYDKSLSILKNYGGRFKDHLNYLLKICEKITGYESVFDLVANAERQAHNSFYDNATARLYRALELFAQKRLKNKYGIETSSVDIEKVKNKEKWEIKKDKEGKIKIGLVDSYELLDELGDEIGKIYREKEKKFKNILNIRNTSKLAHGDRPVNKDDWKKILKFIKDFINDCCNQIKIKIEYFQLPNNF